MRRERVRELAVFAVFVVMMAGVNGYVGNIVRLARCDFAAPYKAEVIRGAGVVCPPVGAVVGWLDIKDGVPSAVGQEEGEVSAARSESLDI